MGEGWSGDLDEALERIAGVATGRGGIHVLRGGHRLAMGLPEDPKAARVVLDFYQPQRLKGRLFSVGGVGDGECGDSSPSVVVASRLRGAGGGMVA